MKKKQSSFLRLEKLSKSFGGVAAVQDVDMTIQKNEFVALIGPNGAGKTTTFNLITGFVAPSGGKLFFKEEDITRCKPHQIAKKGIVRSFQANILFKEKTVKENTFICFHRKFKNNFLKELLNTKRYREEIRTFRKKADEILEFLDLLSFRDHLAGNLPHGQQRMLGVAVALATDPELLLLDEPLAGLNDEETAAMMVIIKKIHANGITILLVEHDMKAVMGNCERIIVLDYGKKIAEGVPAEVINNQCVIEAYLGKGEFDACFD